MYQTMGFADYWSDAKEICANLNMQMLEIRSPVLEGEVDQFLKGDQN